MLTVLHISEQTSEADLLKAYLESKSYEVLSFAPGAANYVAVAQLSPDFVLVELPRNCGEEINLASQMKRNPATADIPVLAYGSHPEKEMLSDLREQGVNTYYPRPVKTARLMWDMENTLSGKAEGRTKKTVPDRKSFDCAALADRQVPPRERIDAFAGFVQKNLSFPSSVSGILKIAQAGETSADDIAKTLEKDPIATATLLKVANSALFAGRGKTITDVSDAIVRIGFKEVKNLTISYLVIKGFSRLSTTRGFDRIEFWFHCLACGVIASELATDAGYPNPEEAFVAGLLCDFGLLLLEEFAYDSFVEILDQTVRYGDRFENETKSLLGFDPYQLAERVLDDWKMPENVAFAVRHAHRFENLSDSGDVNMDRLARSAGIGLTLSKACRIGQACDMHVRHVPDHSLTSLGFSKGLDDSFWNRVYRQMNMFNAFLALDDRKFPGCLLENLPEQTRHVALACRIPALLDPIEVYLRSQGYGILNTVYSHAIEDLEPYPCIIIVRSSTRDSAAHLAAYDNLVNHSPVRPKGAGTVSFLPVLAFCDPNSSLLQTKWEGDNIHAMDRYLDLRMVDVAVERLVNGRPWPDRSQLHIRIRKDNTGMVLIDLVGSLRVNTMEGFKKQILEMVKEGAGNFALNMRKVEGMDSSGIQLIVNLHKKMIAANGRMCLFNLSPAVRSLMKTLHLSKTLTILKDDEALYSMQDSPAVS